MNTVKLKKLAALLLALTLTAAPAAGAAGEGRHWLAVKQTAAAFGGVADTWQTALALFAAGIVPQELPEPAENPQSVPQLCGNIILRALKPAEEGYDAQLAAELCALAALQEDNGQIGADAIWHVQAMRVLNTFDYPYEKHGAEEFLLSLRLDNGSFAVPDSEEGDIALTGLCLAVISDESLKGEAIGFLRESGENTAEILSGLVASGRERLELALTVADGLLELPELTVEAFMALSEFTYGLSVYDRLAGIADTLQSITDAGSVSPWAEDYVRFVLSAGIMEKTGLFKPREAFTTADLTSVESRLFGLEAAEESVDESDRAMTRADIAVWLSEKLGLEPGSNTPSDFDAVPPQAKDAVAAVYNEGIMIGSSGRFRPNDPITREEMSKVLTYILT